MLDWSTRNKVFQKIRNGTDHYDEINTQIKTAEKAHYQLYQYRKACYSQKFHDEHRDKLTFRKAAKWVCPACNISSKVAIKKVKLLLIIVRTLIEHVRKLKFL